MCLSTWKLNIFALISSQGTLCNVPKELIRAKQFETACLLIEIATNPFNSCKNKVKNRQQQNLSKFGVNLHQNSVLEEEEEEDHQFDIF